ncbi:MAG TPA: PAS domain S-box protein [Verrucomicrobiales bacterium]|jgi:PAS domain S-box-containing protein|nr:PAS domain S-box protein [Verrucomicrobiales bacterium]
MTNPAHLPPSEKFSSLHNLLAAIVDSSDDAIISKDLSGTVTSWNKAAERIFGYRAEEMIGKPITVLFPPDRQNEEPAILDRLKRGERVDHFETVRVRKDGGVVHVSLTISPVRDAEGEIVGASKIARDISEKKKWETSLMAASSHAEHQSRMKDEFLATLSHELRTPLQSIISWTQLMNDGGLEPAEIAEGIKVIERSAYAQSRIVEDLLDMNRILSGKVRLDIQPVSLSSVIEESLEAVKPGAAAKAVRLEAILEPMPLPVSADPGRLQQIFWNLLSNSIKFTPRGGKVQVTLQRVNSHVEVTVCDTGIGIAPDFLPFVFDRFRQADSSPARRQGGLGLGLAIVKHLSELHGGSVSARSEGEGKGSCFTVFLPLPVVRTDLPDEARRHPSGPEGPYEPAKLPAIPGVSILLVDDEVESRKVLAQLLIRAGGRVVEAASAQEALDSISKEVPDVLISDIGMPELDGLDFMRAVRGLAGGKGAQIPAIALTAFSRKEDRINAVAAGFQAHIAKPADIVEILTNVKSLANRSH